MILVRYAPNLNEELTSSIRYGEYRLIIELRIQ